MAFRSRVFRPGRRDGDVGQQLRAASLRALYLKPPTERFDPVRHSLEPGPGREVSAAGSVVGDQDDHPALLRTDLDIGAARAGVLRDVGECLGAGEVDGGLDVGGQSLSGADQPDRHRSPFGEGSQRRAEP
jgi:hypothetical protein